ncbi:hypothetical protein POTOM_015342 [Populus tomentosa]|uniref:Uncharacterized protein n=1 Tax=Populus tomentosa TaxID=118781 RepID=A0A8X7ZZR9_POPTO|nr:hypothetical protein POTOM_015342 [Populus tomentosa]
MVKVSQQVGQSRTSGSDIATKIAPFLQGLTREIQEEERREKRVFVFSALDSLNLLHLQGDAVHWLPSGFKQIISLHSASRGTLLLVSGYSPISCDKLLCRQACLVDPSSHQNRGKLFVSTIRSDS